MDVMKGPPVLSPTEPTEAHAERNDEGANVKVKKESIEAGAVKEENREAGSSEDEEDASTRKFRMDSGLLPFPEKLMALLDGEEVSEAMWWLPDGDAFCLIPSAFAEKVLDMHFSGTKFESFTRKLNRW